MKKRGTESKHVLFLSRQFQAKYYYYSTFCVFGVFSIWTINARHGYQVITRLLFSPIIKHRNAFNIYRRNHYTDALKMFLNLQPNILLHTHTYSQIHPTNLDYSTVKRLYYFTDHVNHIFHILYNSYVTLYLMMYYKHKF